MSVLSVKSVWFVLSRSDHFVWRPAHEAVQKLIVAPGNPGYINSYEEYLEKRRGPIEAKAINAAYAAGKFLSNIFQ